MRKIVIGILMILAGAYIMKKYPTKGNAKYAGAILIFVGAFATITGMFNR